MKKAITIIALSRLFTVFTILCGFISVDAFSLENMGKEKTQKKGFTASSYESGYSFENISAQDLKKMLDDKEDFVLIDVHIPEQRHIQGTDDFIPFNTIEENKDRLPEKDKKIVVYCRTGSMSAQAAQELVGMGYTNVHNLDGGTVGWREAGFNIDGPDRIIYLEARRFSFSPDTIIVKQGDKVKIMTKSTDITHGFALEGFNMDNRIEPAKKNIIEFIADKKGEFVFYCSVYCGSGHKNMRGRLVVK
jgi:cytochrome c oxidase subunit 2